MTDDQQAAIDKLNAEFNSDENRRSGRLTLRAYTLRLDAIRASGNVTGADDRAPPVPRTRVVALLKKFGAEAGVLMENREAELLAKIAELKRERDAAQMQDGVVRALAGAISRVEALLSAPTRLIHDAQGTLVGAVRDLSGLSPAPGPGARATGDLEPVMRYRTAQQREGFVLSRTTRPRAVQ